MQFSTTYTATGMVTSFRRLPHLVAIPTKRKLCDAECDVLLPLRRRPPRLLVPVCGLDCLSAGSDEAVKLAFNWNEGLPAVRCSKICDAWSRYAFTSGASAGVCFCPRHGIARNTAMQISSVCRGRISFADRLSRSTPATEGPIYSSAWVFREYGLV